MVIYGAFNAFVIVYLSGICILELHALAGPDWLTGIGVRHACSVHYFLAAIIGRTVFGDPRSKYWKAYWIAAIPVCTAAFVVLDVLGLDEAVDDGILFPVSVVGFIAGASTWKR